MDAITIVRFIFAALVVLLGPGFAVLSWLPARVGWEPGRRAGLLTTLAEAIALSMAIPALLGLWLYIAGIQISGGVAAGLYGLCLLVGLAGIIKRGGFLHGRWLSGRAWAGGLLALLFLAGLVAWRLYQARALALPGWVDSVHHLLIVRKMLEYGGVPPTLEPYLPVTFSYHYGFHLIAALFTMFSGMPAAQGVLWFGQVLNALVAVSVYRGVQAFAGVPVEAQPEQMEAGKMAGLLRAAGPKLAPLLAALLVGFVFQMPAYYLTWGRYTMLTGLLLLGPALAAVIEVRDHPENGSGWVRLVLYMSGMVLTHYFILVLAALFLVVIGLSLAVRGLEQRSQWTALARLVVLAGFGVALASPWLWVSWQEFHATATVGVVNPLAQGEAAQRSMAEYHEYLVYLIGPRRNHILMGMAGIGVLWALLQPRLRALAGWALLLAALSLPWGLRLGPFRPDHYSIVLFFPAAILLAEMLAAGGKALGRRTRPVIGLAALALAGLLFVAWGVRETRSMINSATVLALPADVPALEWVKANTPLDARFYINASTWQGSTYRGVDGGAWLLPYTGRFSLVPPISYSWGSPEYAAQINDWAKRAQKMAGCGADFWNLVEEAGLTHIYLRQGTGSLQPEMLSTCDRLRPVYMQDNVFIYEILPAP